MIKSGIFFLKKEEIQIFTIIIKAIYFCFTSAYCDGSLVFFLKKEKIQIFTIIIKAIYFCLSLASGWLGWLWLMQLIFQWSSNQLDVYFNWREPFLTFYSEIWLFSFCLLVCFVQYPLSYECTRLNFFVEYHGLAWKQPPPLPT